MDCTVCGYADIEQHRFCPGCGTPVAASNPGPTTIRTTGQNASPFIGSQATTPPAVTIRPPVHTYSGAVPTVKDQNTAYLLELVLGFFGLLGVGYFYAGRTQEAVPRFVGWLVYNAIAYVIISQLMQAVIGYVCIPAQLVVQILVPLWSASMLKQSMMQ